MIFFPNNPNRRNGVLQISSIVLFISFGTTLPIFFPPLFFFWQFDRFHFLFLLYKTRCSSVELIDCSTCCISSRVSETLFVEPTTFFFFFTFYRFFFLFFFKNFFIIFFFFLIFYNHFQKFYFLWYQLELELATVPQNPPFSFLLLPPNIFFDILYSSHFYASSSSSCLSTVYVLYFNVNSLGPRT